MGRMANGAAQLRRTFSSLRLKSQNLNHCVSPVDEIYTWTAQCSGPGPMVDHSEMGYEEIRGKGVAPEFSPS